MSVTQLLLQHLQQIRNYVEPLGQQADTLVHLEVAPDGLVDGLELWLHPEELRGVENGAVQMDADAQDEEITDLHVDLCPRKVDLARQRELRRDVLAGLDGFGDQFFE